LRHGGKKVRLKMSEEEQFDVMLGPFRALDLTDEKGLLCGKILADLGADVIKIEKPGGDPVRNIGPFYHDMPDPEKSLYWFAYNMNKRGITLNIETAEGQELFNKLVQSADFVIESFPPGYMDGLGLGYSVLSEINPRIIMTSITPFGQQSPDKDFKTCDIVSMAMGGLMYTTGTPDRPPLRISLPQAFVCAGAAAAMATMVAHYYRETVGEGQHVDVSIQAAVASTLSNFVPLWELNRINLHRLGSVLSGRTSGTRQRTLWPCKDGYVIFYIMGGQIGEKTNKGIAEWMDSKGFAPDYMKQMDWGAFDMATTDQQLQDCLEAPVAQFFLKHTKAELLEGALKRGIMVFPVSNPKDVVENYQLQSRKFWLQVEHPEMNTTITYPGFFIRASDTPCRLQCRAPLVGEHNQEIYEKELGLSEKELVNLKRVKVV
jgi:benzylsuccinate CoA-transferase BbsE subunit